MKATKTGPRAELRAAQVRLATMQAEHETKRLIAETAAIESATRWNQLSAAYVGGQRGGMLEGIWDGFSPNWVDPSTPFNDSLDFHEAAWAHDMPADLEDTLHGRHRPFWTSWGEYRRLQGAMRFLAVGHPVGRNVIDTICDYVVHTGCMYDVLPTDRADKSEGLGRLVRFVQELINEFNLRTGWQGEGEADCVANDIANGEQLLWIRGVGMGKAGVRFVPSEQIAEIGPRSWRDIEQLYSLPLSDWSFGVCQDQYDSTHVRGHFWNRSHQGGNYDFVPSSESVFIKSNVPDEVVRGMGYFYPIRGIMRLLGPVITNCMVGTALLASIAYLRKTEKKAVGSANSITDFGRTASSRMIGGMGGYENIAARIHSPGEIHDVAGVEYEASPMGSGAAEGYIKVFDAGMRLVGARFSMPEYLISSIADTANRATSETTEQGWLRRVERMQKRYKCYFELVIDRVLSIAIAAGKFREFGIRNLEELKLLVTVKITPPPPKTKDSDKDRASDAAMVENKTMSQQTAAERANLDWPTELERMEEESTNEVLNPPEPEPVLPGGAAGGGRARESDPTPRRAVILSEEMQPGYLDESGAFVPLKPADADPRTGIDDPRPLESELPEPTDRQREQIDRAAAILWGDYPGGRAS